MTGREVDRRAEVAGEVAGLLPGGPLVQGIMTRSVQAALEELGRLRSPAIRAAERACGMSREDIAEALAAQEHLIPLAARVLFQAGMTNQEEILEALGAMLGALILNPDDTDEVELIIIGLGDMRRVHLQVLRVIEGPPQARMPRHQTKTFAEQFEARLGDEEDAHDPSGEQLVTIDSETWNVPAIADTTGLSLTRTELALAGLQKSGFVTTPTVVDGPGYLISSSGKTVLEVLRMYQTQAPVRRPQGPAKSDS